MYTHEYIHSESTEHEYAEHPEYSQIVGVFRDSSQATQAVEALKEAGFAENQVQLTEYDPQSGVGEIESELLQEMDRRFFVHVDAPGKEEETVDILAHHGANNSDLPRGTELIHGKLTYIGADTESSSSGSHSIAGDLGSEHDSIDRLRNEPRHV